MNTHNTIRGSSKRSLFSNKRAGFTAVEMVIVITIIGLLAAILTPVYNSVRFAGNVTRTVADLKNAADVTQSLTEINVFPLTEGITTVASSAQGTAFLTTTAANLNGSVRFDQVLLSLSKMERLFESPFVTVKTATETVPATPTATRDPRYSATTGLFYNSPDGAVTHNWTTASRLECVVSTPAVAASAANGANFHLTGDTSVTTGSLPTGVRVVYAILPSISQEAAYKIASAINGVQMMDSTDGSVAQNRGSAVFAAPTAGITTLYVYIAHR